MALPKISKVHVPENAKLEKTHPHGNGFMIQLTSVLPHPRVQCQESLPVTDDVKMSARALAISICLPFMRNDHHFIERSQNMEYSHEVASMTCIAKGPNHGPAPIPEEGKWVRAKEVRDISGLTHGVGWCAPQQGACKLTLNVKDGIIEEALVETLGCTGMTHSAAMAAEILPGKTILEALNTDLVCDAINTAMRELFLQIVYGRTQTAFSEGGLPIGAGLEDLGKGLRSQIGTMYGTLAKGPRYMEMAEGYVTQVALDENNEIIGYEFVNLGKMMDAINAGTDANDAVRKATGSYGRFKEAARVVDPRRE
jgi:NifU-like protein involved in Fe-S cluster formation